MLQKLHRHKTPDQLIEEMTKIINDCLCKGEVTQDDKLNVKRRESALQYVGGLITGYYSNRLSKVFYHLKIKKEIRDKLPKVPRLSRSGKSLMVFDAVINRWIRKCKTENCQERPNQKGGFCVYCHKAIKYGFFK